MRTSKTNLSVIDNTGTRVQPRIVVGESTDTGYKSGDILDANAVINEMPDVDGLYESIDNHEERITALENGDDSRVFDVKRQTTTEDEYIFKLVSVLDRETIRNLLKSGKPAIGCVDPGTSAEPKQYFNFIMEYFSDLQYELYGYISKPQVKIHITA